MLFGGLIPGSDSGKAEEAWVCACASALTVVSFRFLNLNENHLQESRAFWILFCGKKVSEETKIETQPFIRSEILIKKRLEEIQIGKQL